MCNKAKSIMVKALLKQAQKELAKLELNLNEMAGIIASHRSH